MACTPPRTPSPGSSCAVATASTSTSAPFIRSSVIMIGKRDGTAEPLAEMLPPAKSLPSDKQQRIITYSLSFFVFSNIMTFSYSFLSQGFLIILFIHFFMNYKSHWLSKIAQHSKRMFEVHRRWSNFRFYSLANLQTKSLFWFIFFIYNWMLWIENNEFDYCWSQFEFQARTDSFLTGWLSKCLMFLFLMF